MKRIFVFLLSALFIFLAYAQNDTVWVGNQWAIKARNPRLKHMNVRMVEDVKHDTISTWWRRLSVQTNLLDWALTVPNLTLAYDLGDPFVRTTPTLLIGMRNTFGGFRWNNQKNSYDYQGVKMELRRHWVPRKYRKNIVADEPPKAPGRFYAGVYGEYSWANHLNGYKTDSKKEKKDHMWVPYGPSYIAGLSWGYELRKRNYNHNMHMNWDFGIDVGCFYAPKMDPEVFPMVTDIRVALNFRHDRINFLYWKPNERQFNKNTNYNNDLLLRLERCRQQIDSIGGPIFYVTSVKGDSLFHESISLSETLKAIQKHFDIKGLKQSDIVTYETSTKFPVEGMNLGENHSVEFRFGMRPENKLEEQYGTDTIAFSFPFKVRLHGFAEADSLLNLFEKRVTEWREANGGNYPTIKLKHLDKDHVVGHATLQQIIALFKEITDIELKPEQITGIYYKSDQLREVKEEELNLRVKRNCYYWLGVKLHPQCQFQDGDITTRFVLDFDDIEKLQQEFTQLARFFNNNPRIVIERTWNGENNDVEAVTAEDIIEAIAKASDNSITFLKPEMIELSDEGNTLGLHRFSVNYDAVFNKIADRRYFIVRKKE